VLVVGACLSIAPHRVKASRQRIDITRHVKIKHLSQRNFTKQHQAGLRTSLGVGSALTELISEIDTFTEHVASCWCLWRRNPQSLGHYAEHVGHG
jgi:hypothetical protein